jgi:hypothetical protein
MLIAQLCGGRDLPFAAPRVAGSIGAWRRGLLLRRAALRVHSHEPLIVDLEAVRDDDHLLAVFKRVVGRDREIELRRIALPRAGLPHDPRTSHELLGTLLQPGWGEDAVRLFDPTGQFKMIRSNELGDDGGGFMGGL